MATRTEDASDDRPYVGSRVPARHGEAIVRGRGRFTADFEFPGQLHAHVVRSPHAAARIVRVNLEEATRISGVVLALDGEAAARHLDPIPHYIDAAVFGGRTTDVRALALGEVRHYGQPVAVIVAGDKRTARYAASRVVVDYERIDPVLDVDQATATGARRLIDGWDENVIIRVPFANGDTGRAFAEADRVVELEVDIHRFSTQPIETRTYNAVWDAQEQMITFYATAQNPHPLRHVLSRALRMPENRLRVIAPMIGGAFGLKMHGHPEEALICLLAKLTGRPVKWIEDREECLLVGGREQRHRIQLAVRADGRILAWRDHFMANTGAPTACPGWGMAFLTALTMPGPYDIDNLDIDMQAVITNKPPWNASRGYGKEATALALELGMDRVARELGLDPLELRCRNFVSSEAFPKRTGTGLILDSGDYKEVLRRTTELLRYDEWREHQKAARRQGRCIGIGLAYELTPEGGALPGTLVAGFDTSTVKVDPAGWVSVLPGVTTPGTGNETGIAQIVADELGVAIGSVRVIQGDTETCPYGFGNYSGRSTIVGGGSAARAAREVRAKIEKVAAALLEVEPEQIDIRRGRVQATDGSGRSLPFSEVCYAAYTRTYDVAACIEPPLEATCSFRPGLISHHPDEHGRINPYPSYSNAGYATVCEVDPETGKVSLLSFAVVHDCGHTINPLLVEGQACGAIAFGIGGILGEEILQDETGRQLTASFEDYVMPRAGDLPRIEIGHHDTPNPFTYRGLKGAGEAGVGGSAAAVVNAVNDALSSFSVELTRLPLTPPRIWWAIENARRAGRERR